jgi:acetolactate synthase-1/2/3 large subunit
MRSFPSDLTIRGASLPLLEALERALAERQPDTKGRHAALSQRSAELHRDWDAEAERDGKGPHCTLAWLNRCLRDVIDERSIVISEYSFRQEHCPLRAPGSLFGISAAGGLGWGFGAALGAKLGAPDKAVIAVLGDGAYMFANPTACHFVAAAQRLPILTVIYNNTLYGAVRTATLGMFGQGAAAQRDGRMMAELSPAPEFEKIAAAHGGHGERVERPADLPGALRRAAEAVRSGRQALVNVLCPG